MRKDTQGINIYLNLTKEEVKFLKELAKKDCRSMAQYTTFLVRRHLEDNNYIKKDEFEDYN